VKDAEIDEALDKAARAPHPVPSALLKRIADSIELTLTPVRPLPAPWILSGVLVLIAAAVAVAGAAHSGFQGFAALPLSARVAIFGTLVALVWLAASEAVREWIPGSRRRIAPTRLLATVCVALLAVFALLFQDYRTDHFVSAGLVCLETGLVFAVAAALCIAWVLHRGWAVNPASAGLVAGVLAGLAGLSLLELQCPNFQALHVLVWHTLVVPVSGALGALIGWAWGRR
jgi:hypothetical protein